MAITQDKAQALCSKTEWDTLQNSFPPKLNELSPSVLKKQANRIRRFLDKAKAESADAERLALFEEALRRIEAARGDDEQSNDKLAARRAQEKAAQEREKALRDKRKDVKTKLLEKAEKEKSEKEGEPKENDKPQKSGKGIRANLQANARPAKTGLRKV